MGWINNGRIVSISYFLARRGTCMQKRGIPPLSVDGPLKLAP
jgi:hypothetical protein